MEMTHNELIDSLAEHFRARDYITYKNFNLGDWSKCPPIADLVVVTRSYANFSIAIYEVKANRADYLQEMRNEKWKKYLPYCDYFSFATQANVCSPDEIPREAGLIFFNGESWRRKKDLPRRKIEYDYQRVLMLQAMIVSKK